LSIDADYIAHLLPGPSRTHAATVLEREPKEKVRATIAATRTDGGRREPSIEVHQPQLAVVTSVERLDGLTPQLTTKFEVMPTMGPAHRIFELPNMIIEKLRALLGTDVSYHRIVEVQSEQAREITGIAVSDAQRIAELSHARAPAIAGIYRDMASADSSVINYVVANGSTPVADSVINWRLRVGIRQQ